jgi:signal transduction histidine kinase
VAVSVSDGGCGIEEADLGQIFTPFFSTKGPRGTGLGLPFVKRVIEQHGGSVEVNSEPGVGTTFRLIVPVPEESTEDGHERRRWSQS